MSVLSQSARIIYNSYNVTASSNFVYTNAGAVGDDDGWIPAKADEVVVQVNIATLTATTFSYRIEGRSDTYTRTCDIYSEDVTSAMTIDKVINVTERVKEIRIGVKTDGDNDAVASPNNFHAGLILTEYK